MRNEHICPRECPDRQPGCHSYCEQHKRYQEELSKQKQAKAEYIQTRQRIKKPYLSGIKKKEW